MIEFFADLIKLTPVQHLLKHWSYWLMYLVMLFGMLAISSKFPSVWEFTSNVKKRLAKKRAS
ncbi:hypothetical protein [Lysinibacillus sp. NPDC047702]|uniref:hypothetical protein n=1 Tax=unclassified Lysinibacillus TaxID=2636778 RepID=UPI003D004C5D